MLYDAYVPPSLAHGHGAPVFRAVERPGVRYSAARWTPESLGRVVAALGEGAAGLRAISDDDLLAAWGDTVATFLRPGSLERRALDPPLARLCSLSKEGLKAGLEALLDGYRREPAAAPSSPTNRLPRLRTTAVRCLPSSPPACRGSPSSRCCPPCWRGGRCC